VSTANREKREQDAPLRCYVRFGELPAGERSEVFGAFLGAKSVSLFGRPIYEPGGPKERGVSVFEATVQENALVVDTAGPEGWRRRMVFKAYTCAPGTHNRPVYLVDGNVVGGGSTGEPVLRNCTFQELPLTVPVVLDRCDGDEELIRGVECWNRWRYLDGTREGHRTPAMSENFLEAYAPPVARRILNEYNERKWSRRRKTWWRPSRQ